MSEPNAAFREMVREMRRAWFSRPLVEDQDVSAWDDGRVLAELWAEVEGLCAALADGMEHMPSAKVAAASISFLVTEMKNRHRLREAKR